MNRCVKAGTLQRISQQASIARLISLIPANCLSRARKNPKAVASASEAIVTKAVTPSPATSPSTTEKNMENPVMARLMPDLVEKRLRARFAGSGDDLACRPGFDDGAAVKKQDAIGNVARKRDLVRDDQH